MNAAVSLWIVVFITAFVKCCAEKNANLLMISGRCAKKMQFFEHFKRERKWAKWRSISLQVLPNGHWVIRFTYELMLYVLCLLLRDVCAMCMEPQFLHALVISASQNRAQHTHDIPREAMEKTQQCRQWMLCYSFIRNAHVKKSLVIHLYGMSCALRHVFLLLPFSLAPF